MRYYGGKWRIAPWIVGLMPPHEIYVEPFGGAASVLLQKPRANCEVYNDLYADVVNVFKQLRDAPDALLRGIFLTPYSRDEYEAAYEPTSDPLEAARRFVYRSTAGIGSHSSHKVNGFRTSLCDMRYSSAASWASMPETLQMVIARLRGVIIENRDAAEVMRSKDGGNTLHYVDPPYMGLTRKNVGKGYKHELLQAEQHESLLTLLKTLEGKVMVSGYDHELYADILSGWSKQSTTARDQQNANRREVLWMNFEQEGILF